MPYHTSVNMSDLPAASDLQPETINFPDGNPFLVRTATDEKIYYPCDPDRNRPFIRKMSGIENGAYNFETIVFDQKGQAVYMRRLNKDSKTDGVWSHGKQSGTFAVSDDNLTEYDARQKIIRQSRIHPISHALTPLCDNNKPALSADIYTNILDQKQLLAVYRAAKQHAEKPKSVKKLTSIPKP